MLTSRLNFGRVKTSLLITCILGTALYYFLSLPTPEHGRGPIKHALDREYVSQTLGLTDKAASVPTSENIKQTCSKHGFDPYQQKNGARRKVYDVFPFMLELDWLEIRLRELAPHVDYFVITEFTTTFPGKPNPPILRNNWERFKEFENKILHFEIDGDDDLSDVWARTRRMRNSMLYETFPTFVGTEKEASEGDVILVSDVDEIPKPEVVALLRYCEFPERLTLRSHMYYYSFQWLHRGEQWNHPQATTYHGVNGTINPDDLRRSTGGIGQSVFQPLHRWMEKANIWDAAWHCSSCFDTIKKTQKKIMASSHKEYNTPENREPKTIADRVRHGLDLFGRWSEVYDRIEHNVDVPKYVLAHEDRFKYLIDRDGEDAAFVDYNDMVQ